VPLLRWRDPLGAATRAGHRAGLFTESALAWIATSKYLDGFPLYRQAALLARFGGTDISRNTLAASIVKVGLATLPVINLLRDELLDSPLIYGDETELQVLKEPGRSAQAKSYMWAQVTDASGASGTGPPIRLFTYAPDRTTGAARRLAITRWSSRVFRSAPRCRPDPVRWLR
jgi:transposase